MACTDGTEKLPVFVDGQLAAVHPQFEIVGGQRVVRGTLKGAVINMHGHGARLGRLRLGPVVSRIRRFRFQAMLMLRGELSEALCSPLGEIFIP